MWSPIESGPARAGEDELEPADPTVRGAGYRPPRGEIRTHSAEFPGSSPGAGTQRRAPGRPGRRKRRGRRSCAVSTARPRRCSADAANGTTRPTSVARESVLGVLAGPSSRRCTRRPLGFALRWWPVVVPGVRGAGYSSSQTEWTWTTCGPSRGAVRTRTATCRRCAVRVTGWNGRGLPEVTHAPKKWCVAHATTPLDARVQMTASSGAETRSMYKCTGPQRSSRK